MKSYRSSVGGGGARALGFGGFRVTNIFACVETSPKLMRQG